ncbi:uncharacterized protein SOCE26_049980 [Sorangium cellulosum]|uniref:Uncharacterized protein n=1 Tax=Sorangium cellulosum TaxID=56 RepID=A0A2L0EW65_SORCE|nr:hypothetical protein [Sorangium cellulosum]AUX43548.1 uncharacterized protein SOCE26_049980 [Sorangium cellulosum]
MASWTAVKDCFEKDRQQSLHVRIDPARVVGQTLDPAPAKAGVHYFRLWLADMHLSKEVAWMKEQIPAVHSLVQLDFGGRPGLVIPGIADTNTLGAEEGAANIISRNRLLTPTLPFHGGAVSIQVGLLSLPGKDYLGGFLKTLSAFSALLAAPQISAALALAAPLGAGIQELVSGDAGGRLHVGVIGSYAGRDLRSTYIAAIRATAGQLRPDSLWVVDDRLYVGGAKDHTPLTGFDHMLLRLELLTERDDWDQLRSIAEPYAEMLDALGEGNKGRAESCLRQAIVAALKAPELTQVDRRRIAEALKQRYVESQSALLLPTFSEAEGGDLGALLRAAPPAEEVAREGALSLEEALSGI